jgi:hypothetical protein
MPKPEFEFFDPLDIPWRRAEGKAEQLYEKTLASDQDTGDYTRLLRFDPGCDTTPHGVLTHDFWEEVWIIQGSLIDLRLNQTFRAGMYACRPPGMPHGPWRSEAGCTTFEIRYHRPPDGRA